MEMKAKATDNVTSLKLNVIKLFTCTQVLVLEIRKNVIEIGIRVLKLIHRMKVLFSLSLNFKKWHQSSSSIVLLFSFHFLK